MRTMIKRGDNYPYNRLRPLIPSLVVFLLMILASPLVQASNPHVCRVGCNYNSISEAVETAAPGDRITIEAGKYRENAIIRKDLNLVGTGEGNVVINQHSEGSPTVTVQGAKAEVTFENVTITGAIGAPVDRERHLYPDGLSVHGGANVELKNVIISDNKGCGLRLLENSVAEVRSSSIARNGKACCGEGNSKLALKDTRVSGNGVVLTGTASATLSETSVSNHQEVGLELRDSSSISVKKSKIGTCAICLLLTDNSYLQLRDSKVQDAGDGIRLLKRAEAEIQDSELTDCTSALELRERAQATIVGSKILSNDHGLSLFDASKLEIRNCRVAYNDIGIKKTPAAKADIKGCGVRFYTNFESDSAGFTIEIRERIQDRCER